MNYILHILILIGIYLIISYGLNLLVGFGGLLTLCHAVFYGIGAYTTAILLTQFGVNFFLSVILGIIITAAISFFIGIILSKFSGDYYALGSFGFNVIVFSIFLNWRDLTRGALGIAGIPKPEIFGIHFFSNSMFLVIALIFLIIVYIVARFIVHSSFGRVLKAIREDEKAIQVFGYNTLYYKLTIFVISAGMAAIAGSLFASYITYVDPSTFTLMESVFILAIIILGGLANLQGSILGALFLVLLPEILRFVGLPFDIAAQMRQVIYGTIIILLMLYRPKGLLGEYKL